MAAFAKAGWGLMAVLSVGVAGYALFLTATGFRFVPPNILANNFPSGLGIRTHIAVSGVALLLGPFQFLKGLRRSQPALHRWLGRIYVAACLVGGVAGGVIALFSTSGPIAGFGFLTLGILWFTFTLLALGAAMQKRFASHERWMIRSFALTFAAVTLRLYLPPAVIASHGEFPVDSYQIIAWACWVPNILIAEAALRLRRRHTLQPA
jgi:uncharacterized membrane protein